MKKFKIFAPCTSTAPWPEQPWCTRHGEVLLLCLAYRRQRLPGRDIRGGIGGWGGGGGKGFLQHTNANVF